MRRAFLISRDMTDPEPDTSDLDALIARVDPDRWLSSRFIAEPQARADVITLYAYDHELARAPRVASNALLGEIRLTWWREVLEEAYAGLPVRHHPTAQALAEMAARRRLSRGTLEAMIDARYRELDASPMSGPELADWAQGTGGAAAVLAAHILDPDGPSEAARAAGTVWAMGHRIGSGGAATDEAGPMFAKALREARTMGRSLSVAAFPAGAHAALARLRAAGRRPSVFGAQLRMLLAVALGRI
jgi:phytoene synthase